MNNKPTLILLHGALGSKEQFSVLEAQLKDSFDIYTLNFEGHGGRNTEREFSTDHFVENLLELIDRENLEPANIFGFSMGGYVALKLAIDHPEKLKKVMTLGTKFEWTEEIAGQEVSRLNPLKVEAKVPQFAEELKRRHAPMDWHQVLSKTGEMMLSLGAGEALEPKEFSRVQCPVLITRGSEDQMVSSEESQEIAKAIPNGEFYLFENFKHPLEQVDVGILTQKIKTFFTV